MKQTNTILRGDIFWISFDPATGTEIQKTRPAVILSCNPMNINFTRVIAAPITSNVKKVLPFEFLINRPNVQGKVLLDQIKTVDKSRVGKKINSLLSIEMTEIEEILKKLLGLI